MNLKITFLFVLVLLAITIAILGASPSPAGPATLPGSIPGWANSKNYRGATDASGNVSFRVYLPWQDAAGAAALARAVSDPDSASYGKYLTSAQFRRQFAPSQAQVGAVQAWLRSQGFAVTYTPTNNHFVSAEGTVAQAEAAFSTKLGVYLINGMEVVSPSRELSIPNSIADAVQAVVGLDDSALFVTTYHVADKNAPPSDGFRNAPPLSAYWAQLVSPYAYPSGFTALNNPATAPWTVKGYTPAQIKGAYNIPASYDGAGQTVAVVDAFASPTIFQDVNQWSINRGLPTMNRSQLVEVVPPGIYRKPENPRFDPQGWYGEETLDIEAVHGMAPGAKIVYVGTPNNRRDLDAALNHIVDQRLAQIVTNSWGYRTELLPPGFIKPFEDTLIQAAIEGIGVYFASGDEGDESSIFGFPTTDFPPSSPWVTAVGGTSLAVGQNNSRLFETGWGTSNYNCDTTSLACSRDDWIYGSGGGVSRIFAEPFYQSNAGLNLSGRGVPDVAAPGDPQTGFLMGQTQHFPNGNYYDEFRIAGTSLSSPLFAGIMALVDQSGGHPHGFANPLFYKNPTAFNDILSVKTAVARRNFVNSVDASDGTVDLLRSFDDYSGSPSQHTNAGWDNVTGLGTPGRLFFTLIP